MIHAMSSFPSSSTPTMTPAHHQLLETMPFKYMHESTNYLDYVQSLVELTVNIIDTMFPAPLPSYSHVSCATNTALPGQPTTTAAVNKPVVDTKTFVKYFLRTSRTRHSTLVLAMFYLFRIKPRLVKARPLVSTEDRRYLSCGRRMFLAAIILAHKYQHDRTYRNKAWSQITALPVDQITKAERLFLGLLDFRLHISKEAYDRWVALVQQHCKKINSHLLPTLASAFALPSPCTLPPLQPLSVFLENQPPSQQHELPSSIAKPSTILQPVPQHQKTSYPVEQHDLHRKERDVRRRVYATSALGQHTYEYPAHQLPTPPSENVHFSPEFSQALKRKWTSD